MTLSRTQAADAVAEADAIGASRALYVPVVNREGPWHLLGVMALPPVAIAHGPLFCEHKFTPGEISLWLGKQDRDLDQKDVLSVKILMQAVVVARAVLQEQRGGS